MRAWSGSAAGGGYSDRDKGKNKEYRKRATRAPETTMFLTGKRCRHLFRCGNLINFRTSISAGCTKITGRLLWKQTARSKNIRKRLRSRIIPRSLSSLVFFPHFLRGAILLCLRNLNKLHRLIKVFHNHFFDFVKRYIKELPAQINHV